MHHPITNFDLFYSTNSFNRPVLGHGLLGGDGIWISREGDVILAAIDLV